MSRSFFVFRLHAEAILRPSRKIMTKFEGLFLRLLAGKTPDLYEEGISVEFEFIAKYLMAETLGREFMWYDGVDGLISSVKSRRQVEFKGEMWVGDDLGHQWKEDFRAIVTDKRITKQGLWITIWIGADRAEGDYLTM